MTVTIKPSRANGTVIAPPSKSMSHRLLIASGLADGISRIRSLSPSEDTLATIDCLRALGAKITFDGNSAVVQGIGGKIKTPTPHLPCRESGSTLRFFIPIAAISREMTTFSGSETLFSRPLSVYETLFSEQSLPFLKGKTSLALSGPLTSGDFQIKGNISSQFVSGLLFALPLLSGHSTITLIPPIESRSYIDLTLAALSLFGVKIDRLSDTVLSIPGQQHYTAREITVEGDESNAAFFHALTLLGDNCKVTGLDPDTRQGDRVFLSLAEQLSTAEPISLADCPDLAPILFVLAALKGGATFRDTARLADKESDRAAVMKEELAKCGITLTVANNSVTVQNGSPHAPSVPLSGHNDHRIVMALSILLTRLGGKIEGAEAVKKSLPDFFERLSALGISLTKELSHET